MIFGDPNSFAIWFDRVDSWSTPDFENGCFAFFIGKTLICSQNSTLGVDLHLLSKLHCLGKSVEDDYIFNAPIAEAYSALYERAFPSADSDAESSDYTHLVSARSLLDEGHNVFLVESGSKARLIYGMDGKPVSVFDVFIDRGEFQRVICTATTWRA
ncbi:immunity 42 family protein [Burkholderia semiarida]|uniref:immunity 42 family protein n=1 Tax=Burkholderia semiarida TaxID=2843303 RepID=UPI0038783F21